MSFIIIRGLMRKMQTDVMENGSFNNCSRLGEMKKRVQTYLKSSKAPRK